MPYIKTKMVALFQSIARDHTTSLPPLTGFEAHPAPHSVTICCNMTLHPLTQEVTMLVITALAFGKNAVSEAKDRRGAATLITFKPN